MDLTKRHLHIERPSERQINQILKDKTFLVREVYLNLHALILEALPGVFYSVDCKDGVIGYGVHQYGYNGWGMLALAAHTNWVTLMFMKGVDLHDSEGLLEGTGKKMRHVKLRSLKDVESYSNIVKKLIYDSSKMYED